MFNLFCEDGSPLISPGDLLDKYIILCIKFEKNFQQEKDCIQEELRRLFIVLEHIYKNFNYNPVLLRDYILELEYINKQQWHAEDRVRFEKSWEAAIDARDLNSQRVEIKNKINKLFNFPIEVKKYKS